MPARETMRQELDRVIAQTEAAITAAGPLDCEVHVDIAADCLRALKWLRVTFEISILLDRYEPPKRDCEVCRGTGWSGDLGPGQGGNAEGAPCECTEVPRIRYTPAACANKGGES